MVSFKIKHRPETTAWTVITELRHFNPVNLNFSHAIFKINDTVYTSNSEEFQKAYFWERLREKC